MTALESTPRPVSPFTPAQEQAIFAAGSVAISAGAGSGKTRVLAERILHLLRGGARPGQMVAVTFTEAAAAELRGRITEFVEARSEDEGGAWLEIRSGLPLMQVSTIHGLCGRVAREHPVESGAGLGFTVLDEDEARAWLDDHLTPVLAELPLETLLLIPGKIRSEVIETLLQDPTAAQAAMDVAVRMAAVDPAVRASQAWEGVKAEWNGALECLSEIRGPAGDELENLRLATVQTASSAPLMGTGLLAVRALLGQHKGTLGRGWTRENKSAAHASLNTLKSLAARGDLLGEAGGASQAHDAALVALHEMFSHVRHRFAELKAEQEVATFADLEVYADTAMLSPEVRNYYASRWTHLLIDEAQDTNPVQWRILSALAGEQVNLTVVGDEKQSIYAFRRADVEIFRAAQQEVQLRGGQVVAMGTSFRTHAELVDVINAYFGSLMHGPDAGRPTAARFEVLSAHRPEHPFGEGEPSAEVHVIQGDDVAALRDAEARHLAQRIQALLLTGVPVYDRALRGTRPIRLSDIALLFRVRSGMKACEDALVQAGLPYVVYGGRGLYDRPEVQDAVNLLQAVADPTADVVLAATLRGPHAHLTDDTLLEIAQDRQAGESFWDAARRSPRGDVQAAVTLLEELREASVTLSASQLLSEADTRTGALLVHAAQPDGARRLENVRRFQELLRSWAQDGLRDVVSVAGHLTTLTRQGAQEAEALSPHPDAVQLMTVHGSKGLEFPVVIVVDALRQGGGPPPSVRFDAEKGVALRLPLQDEVLPAWTELEAVSKERDLSEAERVAYVAFTRAADLLMLSVTAGAGPKAQEKYEAFVSHLPQRGVERFYLSPDEVGIPEPLLLNRTGPRPTLAVQSGPGVILPGSLPVTSLGTYLSCPRLFAYRHLERRLPLAQLWSERQAAEASNPERRVAGRQIGDAVHRALEHGWTAVEIEKQFSYLAAADLADVVGLVQSISKEPYHALQGRVFVRERAIQIPFGNVTFEGVVDAFDAEGGLVLDYKTDKTVEPEHHLAQLALYAHHLGAQEAALAYLRHDQLHWFTAEDLTRGFAKVEAAVTHLHDLDFAPTPSFSTCRFCAFRGVCDAADLTPQENV